MKSFARALFRLIAAIGASVAAVALLVANPLTRPAVIGEAAIEAEAHAELIGIGSDLVLRQALAGEEGQEGQEGQEGATEPTLSPSEQERLRSVLSDAFSPEWLATVIRESAIEAEEWVAGTGQPPIVIDMTEPKERIRNHPDAPLLVASLADPDDSGSIDPDTVDPRLVDLAVSRFLAGIPDEVVLSEAGFWDGLVDNAAGIRDTSQRVALVGGAIALVAAAAGLALTAPPRVAAMTGWAGWLLLWVALPTLALSWALPFLAGQIPLLDLQGVGREIVDTALETTRLVGWIALGAAFGLWGLTHVLRDRGGSPPATEESIHADPGRVPVGVG